MLRRTPKGSDQVNRKSIMNPASNESDQSFDTFYFI